MSDTLVLFLLQSYHGIELVINPDMCNRWNDVIEADLSHGSTEQVDWDQVMEGYEATFDGPACVSTLGRS